MAPTVTTATGCCFPGMTTLDGISGTFGGCQPFQAAAQFVRMSVYARLYFAFTGMRLSGA
uniref:Uncharacterized protein n=1 Tax=Erwinia amylovora ATCC BAA-2158 TaxID=889211 RepID=E5B771_ERWAM|nr:hypothetical protein predicted by Glimmer/Critica [Erwinia amylovora ATCC BAA-2158]